MAEGKHNVPQRTDSPEFGRFESPKEVGTKITVKDFQAMRDRGERIVTLTGYNEADTTLLNEVGVEGILVGDSYAMVRKGKKSTDEATMEMMVGAVEDAAKGNSRAMLIGDMPFQSYDNPDDAVKNARLLIKAGADVVKLEGGVEVAKMLKAIKEAGIDVMGHICHTPQTAKDHNVECRNEKDTLARIGDAKAIEAAGTFAMVIELADQNGAERITKAVKCPTIGIGAGLKTSGQILVIDDLVGETDWSKTPRGVPNKFVGDMRWDRTSRRIAVQQYFDDVKAGKFPTPAESFDVYKPDE